MAAVRTPRRIERSGQQAIYIGVDEAGYGPNLGPLVVAAVALSAPSELAESCWWRSLRPAIGRARTKARWIIDDSKAVLARADGPVHLARLVETCAGRLGARSLGLLDLISLFAPADGEGLRGEYWYSPERDRVAHEPTVSGSKRRASDGNILSRLEASGVHLLWAAARVIFPPAFNGKVRSAGNKATAEIEWIRELLAGRFVARDWPTWLHVDRLGGRRYYRALVEDIAGDAFVLTLDESELRSSYRFGPLGREVEVTFEVDGDSRHFPIAMASMLAKYLRERCMAHFNAFWREHLPELRPTAGYPSDSRRFRDEVDAVRQSLGLSDDQFWRGC